MDPVDPWPGATISTPPIALVRDQRKTRRRRAIGIVVTALAVLITLAGISMLLADGSRSAPPVAGSPTGGQGGAGLPVDPNGVVATDIVVTTEAVVEPSSLPPGFIVVPDGVGLDYQSAQDLWRDAGLHVLPAYTEPRGKIPIWDRNWLVLAQDPPAGTVVADGSFIRATVKKK